MKGLKEIIVGIGALISGGLGVAEVKINYIIGGGCS